MLDKAVELRMLIWPKRPLFDLLMLEYADGSRTLIEPKWQPWDKKKCRDQQAIYFALVSLAMPKKKDIEPRRLYESSGWVDPDDQHLTHRQWCMLNGFSERHGRRLIKTGQGPVLTWSSAYHFCISAANNRRWVESRTQRPSRTKKP
jgi:hypothetical protein